MGCRGSSGIACAFCEEQRSAEPTRPITSNPFPVVYRWVTLRPAGRLQSMRPPGLRVLAGTITRERGLDPSPSLLPAEREATTKERRNASPPDPLSSGTKGRHRAASLDVASGPPKRRPGVFKPVDFRCPSRGTLVAQKGVRLLLRALEKHLMVDPGATRAERVVERNAFVDDDEGSFLPLVAAKKSHRRCNHRSRSTPFRRVRQAGCALLQEDQSRRLGRTTSPPPHVALAAIMTIPSSALDPLAAPRLVGGDRETLFTCAYAEKVGYSSSRTTLTNVS